MKLKKYSLVILSILILLVFVSSASAADTNGTDVLSIDESANHENNLLSIDNNIESNELDNNTLKASNDEILTAENNYWYVNGSKTSSGDGSEANPFNTLNDGLTNSGLQNGDTIMIASGEYKGTNNTGLTISKNLNFIKYGDSEAIFDAEQSRRIWNVTATSINITGLTFKNGKAGSGGAIYFINAISNSNINASFINNTAVSNGGANWFNNEVLTSNIAGTYTNNAANEGGANYFRYSVSGSNITGTYTNNTATYKGGANYFHKVSGLNVTGTYTNNKANGQENYSGGGANYFFKEVSNSTVTGTYTNNTATQYGGANYFQNSVSNSNITGIFINNTASNSAIIHFDIDESGKLNVQITNAIFLNNNCTHEISANATGVVVKDSWFGNNASNYKNQPNINDNVQIENWLFLNATADYSSLLIGDSSNITFKLYYTDGENVSDFDNSKFPVVNLTLTATKGDVDKTTITLDNIVKYTVTEKGKGSVTAKIENASYTVYFDNIPINVDLSASAQNITYLENETLTLTYNNTATGKINITLKSKNYNKTIERDINQTITIEDLPAGDYDVTVEYFGDNVFSNATAYTNFTVNKITTEIIVNSSTMGVKVNGEADIVASLEPANAGNLTYKSSDETIVKVEDSKIMGLKEGNATITVSFAGNDNYAAAENKTINVTVSLNDASVKVNNNTLNLLVDDTFNLIATTEPKTFEVNYTSSNPSIVTVDNKGNVVAVSEGNATITVSFRSDGVYAENSTTVNVTVSKVPTEISANPDSLNLLVGNEAAITATLAPPEAGNVTFTTSNKNIATVDNQGNIIAVGEGNATITVSFKGNDKYAAAENKTINVTVRLNDASVSVNNNTLNLLVDDTFNLIATTEPKTFEVNYTSSNPTVVTVDGKGNVVAVSEGNTTITVSFRSDGVYAENSTTVNVTVSKVPTEISFSLDLLVGNKINIVATLTPTDAGNLTFTSSDKNIVTVDNQGNLIAVGEGNATITVSFAGNNKYHAENKTIKVNVQKVNTTMDASAGEITEGENATISVTLPNDATGNVTAKINGKTYTSQVKNGKATITIPGLGEGYYNVTVTYSGDYMYNNASTTVIIVVNPAPEPEKKNLTIQASAEPITAGQDAKVIVTNLEDATGNITVIVNGKTYTAPIKNSESTITIPGLTENETAYINYAGDKNYNPTTTIINITVNPAPKPEKKNITLDANAEPITIGEDAKIIVTNLEDATGNITVTVNGKTYTAPIKDGETTITIPGLNKTVTADILYPGDENYNNATTTVIIVVKPAPEPEKKNLTIQASAEPITVGDDAKVVVTGLKDATGEISVIVNGKTYTAPIKNSESTITIPGLTENETAYVNYAGDKNYNPALTTVYIVVYPKNATISINAPDVTKYYTGPERFVANVTDSKGTPLSNKNVTIVINGRSYNKVTDENGTVSLGLNLNSGVYNVISTVDNQTVISLVTILPTVNATDVVKMYKNGTQYYATFRDSKGNYLADGTTVKFNINGVFYERKVSGDKGLAKLNINLPPGEYVITASNPSTGEMASNKVTVLATLAENRNITKYYKNATQYTVKVLGADGNPVGAGKTVTFNINGVMYQRQTNESGIAQLSINLPPGDYTITASYEGYNVANTITVLPVLSASDLKMKYMDGSQFKATLLDGQGNPYPNKNVTFNINGVFYNRPTDADGVAKLNIRLPAGEYIITSSYNGCNIVNKITIS